MSECLAFGLTLEVAASEIVSMIEVVDTWQKHFKGIGVTARDIEDLAKEIDGESLRSQGAGFDADEFAASPAKKKRPGPFSR